MSQDKRLPASNEIRQISSICGHPPATPESVLRDGAPVAISCYIIAVNQSLPLSEPFSAHQQSPSADFAPTGVKNVGFRVQLPSAGKHSDLHHPETRLSRQVIVRPAQDPPGDLDRPTRLASLLSTALSRSLGQNQSPEQDASTRRVDYAPNLSPTTDAKSTGHREAI